MQVGKVLLLLSFCCSLVYCGNIVTCCDVNVDPGQDQEWFIYAPPDVRIQCFLNNGYTRTQNIDPDLTGYGWEINGCNFAQSTICGSGVWCFADNDDGGDGEDDSLDGLGSNSPLTSWTDSNAFNACGSTASFIRTWASNSLCGGVTITVTQAISIVDTIPPTLCVPEDFVMECPPSLPANPIATTIADNYFGSPDAIDYCFPIDDSDIIQTANLIGNQVVRTFSVSDQCNNAVTGQQVITLADTTPPILERLPNVILECGAAIPATAPLVVDVCFLSTAPVATFTDVVYFGECTGSYSYERTWTSTDSAGNVAQETQIIVVEDTTPPVISLSAGGVVVPLTVEVFTVNCFSDIVLDRFTQADTCSGVADTVVPSEISLSHNENEGRTEVLVRYTSSDNCGNTVTWADLWQVDSGLGVFSDVISGPTQPVAKGTTFTITIDVTNTNACAPFGLIAVDAGFATLVSATSSPCFAQSATGIIFCDPAPGAPTTLTLDLTVPATFLGSDLIISVSWHYNYRTIGVLVGSYVVNFL